VESDARSTGKGRNRDVLVTGRERTNAARAKWEHLSTSRPVISWCVRLFEHDQSAHGSVLGSAIALRLFLFVVPANIALVGLFNVIQLGDAMQEQLQSSYATGEVAKSLDNLSWWNYLWLFLSGTVLMLWAGRSLAKVLSASSGSAWSKTARESKLKVTSIITLGLVLFLGVAASSAFGQIRDSSGPVIATAGALGIVLSISVVWFVVLLTLPRNTTDPGALIPGAVFMGVSYSALQWFMQFYLPLQIERGSDTMGNLAITVATLGNFFFIGRIMSASFVLGAFVYTAHGSLSQQIFKLPGLRSIPRRIPRVGDYFDLSGFDDGKATLEHIEVGKDVQ